MTDPWRRRVEIGEAVLYLGDCLEVLPTLGPVDAVVTDPPYGINFRPLSGQGQTSKRTGKSNTWHMPAWWDVTLDPKWIGAVCRASDIVAWFCHWRQSRQIFAEMSFPPRCEIIWAKDCHTSPPHPLASRDERILIFSRHKFEWQTFDTTIWDEPVIPTWKFKNHPNEKPLALMKRLVNGIPAAIVLDPFMGSGTTGVACANLGRRFIGIEIEERYFDIACRRIKAAYAQGRLFEDKPVARQLELEP